MEKEVKILLMTVEICCFFAVVALAVSTSAENWMGHAFYAAYIILFSAMTVILQREQQGIDLSDDDED